MKLLSTSDKRVRAIYSVIGSSNRLEVLRILHTQGPLSYSELKTLAGFKSKKESGKFAYHLRKLLKQMLITLNRSERKYSVSGLGRLILNLTRQIEEQSLMESGKLFVRTSKQSMEEFNVDKITQSLIREGGMTLESAQRITEEAEGRLHKFQASYLTAPLIREIVNAVLLEHGYEDYRHRLTRLGVPVYDINLLMENVGRSLYSAETVFKKIAQSVFTEYLLLTQMPKDISDSHVSGDLHVSNIGVWSLMPDTLFLDLEFIDINDVGWGGKMPWIPRLIKNNSLDDSLFELMSLIYSLSREVSTEISFQGFSKFIKNNSKKLSHEQISFSISRALQLSNLILPQSSKPFILTFHVTCEDSNDDLITDILTGYAQYIESVPISSIKLILHKGIFNKKTTQLILDIIKSGGSIAFDTSNETHSYLGVKNTVSTSNNFGTATLHSLSLNLPRLATESNKDSTYFRAKLALLIQSAVPALSYRRKFILDTMNKGLLPTISKNPAVISTERIPLIIQLIGLEEAASILVGERTSSRLSSFEKIIAAAIKSASESANNLNEDGYVSILPTEGNFRLASLDSNKYGKSVTKDIKKYSDVPLIKYEDGLSEKELDRYNRLFKMLNGGYSLSILLPNTFNLKNFNNLVNILKNEAGFFRLGMLFGYCLDCGSKTPSPFTRCNSCRSTSIKKINTGNASVRDDLEVDS